MGRKRGKVGGLLVLAAFAAGYACAQARAGWTLAWSDEFDKPGLPDAKKWTYETGFVRNHESQYYTKARAENARVENGILVIEGRKEAYKGPDGKDAQYTAASVTTEGLFETTYGRVEVRAKLPRGRGQWPAIWMLGTSIRSVGWPKCGEIDIMEFVGHEPEKVFATVHWLGADTGKHASLGGNLPKQKPSDDFHVYAVEWHADRMDFFYDETQYFTYPVAKAGADDKNPFHKPHYLLMNLAIGGSWGGQKGIDDGAFPQRYEIDYVRVYKQGARP
jgi:beta-glucanase (GH16 family)